MAQLSEEFRLGNIVNDIMEAAELNPEELDRDLNVLFQLSTALVRCFKGAFDAEGNVRTQQPSRELDIITFHPFVGTGVQTVFPLVNEIDIATELIGFVTLDALRIFTPADYTFTSTDLTIPTPPANGAVGQYAIIQNTAGVIDRIESITAGLGAYLIGFPDDNNLYQATTAGDALEEVMTSLNQLVTDLGLITGLLRNDGSVQLVANWEVNLRKENGTAAAATGTIDVIGTPVHLDTFTIFDGIIGVGNTFQFTADVLNAEGSLEFTGVPSAGDTVDLIDVDGVNITFEYYLNGGPDTSAPANTGVQLGVDASGTESSFRTAVGVSVLKISGALNGAAPNPTTDLTQDLPGTAGNTTITVVGSNMTKTDFIGGLDETNPTYIPVVIGALHTDTAADINTAINESALAVTATNPTPPNARVNVIHDLSSATGNRPILQSGVALTLAGLGGGINGLLGDLCAAHRIRNLPVSVRDGDVVVHEQLQSLLAVIQTFADLFLLLDGSSIMNGQLRMGGNKIIDVADGVDDKDAANKGQLNLIENLLVRFIPTLGAADPDFAASSQELGPLSFGNVATVTASVPQDSGATIKTLSGGALPGAPDHFVNKQHVDNEVAILQSQISNIETGGATGGNEPDGSVSVGSSLDGCEFDGTLGDVGDIDAGGVYNFESMSINSAQAPTDDTFIFNNGAVAIGNDIDATGYKLEISSTGDFTLDAGATITCKSLIIRSGGEVIINGTILAEGDITEHNSSSTDHGSAFGVTGFVRITSTGKCDTGSSSTITTGICNIQAGATSTMQGTINAVIKGRAYTPQFNDSPSGFDGNTFGKGIRRSLNLTGSTLVPALDAEQARVGFVLGGDSFVEYAYAGQGGSSNLGLTSSSANGGGGGGGGTAGGDGGGPTGLSPTNGRGGVAGEGKGAFRPYLLPLAPGGGGATGYDATGPGHAGGEGGGVINIYVVGDLVATGMILNAFGTDGILHSSTNNPGSGGGGGGAIRAACSGVMTDGTGNSDGGDGFTDAVGLTGGGGGGGGSVHFIADDFLGTQSRSVSGGTKGGGVNPGADGSDGTEGNVTDLATADILCLAGEGYWAA